MATNFVPLRCRSNFSFLHGVCTIDALLEQAARQGMGAVGIADIGGLYGTIQFYCKAQEYNIKPIIGLEMETEAGKLMFLARDFRGYGNLPQCKKCVHNLYGTAFICINNIVFSECKITRVMIDVDYSRPFWNYSSDITDSL